MDILRWINEQVAAVKTPLFAVSITAIPKSDTPLLLFLHWHGFRRATPLALPGIKPDVRSIPGSAVQINERWRRIEEVECSALDAAWQLGAWDLQRHIHRGCNAVAAAQTEADQCRRAFGEYPSGREAREHYLLDDGAPDRSELMAMAARSGYMRWLFRPVSGGVWGQISDDVTLSSDGRRAPPCPVAPADPHVASRVLRRPQGSLMTYRFGRSGDVPVMTSL